MNELHSVIIFDISNNTNNVVGQGLAPNMYSVMVVTVYGNQHNVKDIDIKAIIFAAFASFR